MSIKVGLDALNIQDSQHLKNSLNNCDDPLRAISDFQEENSILLPTLKSALNLLDLHNVKRIDFHMSIADELKENLLKRVDELSSSIHSTSTSKDQQSVDLKKLEELLEKSFPLINIPRLTPLVLQIMKGLPKINEVYLNFIKDDESLYSISPIEVKRQIWSLNNEVFLRELQPLFDKFINSFDEVITYFEPSIVISTNLQSTTINLDLPILKEWLLLHQTAYTALFKTYKRHMAIVTDICKLIGSNRKLYEFTISSLSSLYVKTRDWFYSTLKSHLMQKLAEMYNTETLSTLVYNGPGDTLGELVLKFGNLINMCLKERKLDGKRAKELESIMESKKFEKILPDVAFILADPFVVDMLSRNAMSLLNRCVQNELLPRNCTELIFVLRLLSLSLLSWELIDTQANKEPKIDASLITEYLPNLAYFITDFYEKLYDDSLASLANPTTQTTITSSILVTSPTVLTTSATSVVTPSTPTTPGTSASAPTSSSAKTSPPIVLKISTRKVEIISSIKSLIAENELCSVLYLYLVNVCFELNDWVNLKVLLPSIKYPNNNVNLFEKWFLYQIFSILIDKSIIDQFKHDWFVSLIFDDFLFNIAKQKDDILQSKATPTSSHFLNSNVFYDQIYKLIEKIYPAHLSSMNFTRLIEFLKPKKFHSSSVHITYLKVKSKLEQVSSASSTNEPMDTR